MGMNTAKKFSTNKMMSLFVISFTSGHPVSLLKIQHSSWYGVHGRGGAL